MGFCLSSKTNKWIIDCVATDTMTYDSGDLLSVEMPNKKLIQITNGELVRVEDVGTISVFPETHFNNFLFIPQLSHKLLYVSQLTKEKNCTVLMSSNSRIVQDLRTGKIIGRGTEKDGLYYVDEMS